MNNCWLLSNLVVRVAPSMGEVQCAMSGPTGTGFQAQWDAGSSRPFWVRLTLDLYSDRVRRKMWWCLCWMVIAHGANTPLGTCKHRDAITLPPETRAAMLGWHNQKLSLASYSSQTWLQQRPPQLLITTNTEQHKTIFWCFSPVKSSQNSELDNQTVLFGPRLKQLSPNHVTNLNSIKYSNLTEYGSRIEII